MPPDAIASSDVVTTVRAPSPPLCACARRHSSRVIACGNFGARPNPPHSGSNSAARACNAALSTSVPGSSPSPAVASLVDPVQRLGQLSGLVEQLRPSVVPRVVDGRQQLEEPGLRVVRAAEEGLAIRESGTPSSATRRGPRPPAPPPCRSRRRRGAPRGRPSRTRTAGSSPPRRRRPRTTRAP